MPTERIQRRIDALLDEADVSVTGGEWASVAEKARAVLAIDEANADGRTCGSEIWTVVLAHYDHGQGPARGKTIVVADRFGDHCRFFCVGHADNKSTPGYIADDLPELGFCGPQL